MSEDWETGDFEVKKVDDDKFGDEKVKVVEKPAPAPDAPKNNSKPAQKKETKPAIKAAPANEDPIAERERIERLANKRDQEAAGATSWRAVWFGVGGRSEQHHPQ